MSCCKTSASFLNRCALIVSSLSSVLRMPLLALFNPGRFLIGLFPLLAALLGTLKAVGVVLPVEACSRPVAPPSKPAASPSACASSKNCRSASSSVCLSCSGDGFSKMTDFCVAFGDVVLIVLWTMGGGIIEEDIGEGVRQRGSSSAGM
ncbi:hypothetical protein KC363_g204 [Hortaea werneckii]|nr:hypothetical protein KC363_g204 [Hortaea werneckii]